MGLSCSAIHVRVDSPSEVAAELRRVVRDRAFVSDSLHGWVSVYDAASEQDFEEGKRLAARLSARLKALVLVLDLYDDAITRYALFTNGELADEFNSCPDYFGPGSSPAAPGNAQVLERYGKAGNKLKLYESLLKPMDLASLPEEGRLRGIARAFNIATTRALLSCSSLSPTQERKMTAVHATGDAAAANELARAARAGDVETVRALLERGVAADSKDAEGNTPIARAVEGGHLAVLQLLLERPQLRGPLTSALFWAVGRQNADAINALLLAGADINGRSMTGSSPLFRAAFSLKADPAIVRLLLAAGADPIAKLTVQNIGTRPSVTTPLHGAATIASVAVVELLAAAASTLEVTNGAGKTPLMVATERRRLDVAAVLTKSGSARLGA
jgi:ankyrin repeat protein